MNYVLILAYILSAITIPISLTFVKQYTKTKDMIWLVFSLICYMIVIWTYVIIVPTQNVTAAFSILKVINILVVALLGFMFYNEIPTFYQKLGILTAIISIILFSIGK
jgi:multidrug transporter EmrE-like cation transporter